MRSSPRASTLRKRFSLESTSCCKSPIRPHISKPDKAPVWIPKNNAGYFVITCTECLRSFSVPDDAEGEVREVDCVFCDSKVCDLADVHKLRKPPRNI